MRASRNAWILWATLVVVSATATLDLFAWAQNDRIGASIGASFLVLVTILVFRVPVGPARLVTSYERALFAWVIAFAGWVAVWGLLFSAHVANALPFAVPPLHARFLGSMYLSGAVSLTLNLMSREWREIRVTTTMLAIWTGMLGLVSLFHLDAFDWSRPQTWFWFFAYVCFPLVAAWIAWSQRSEPNPNDGTPFSSGLRRYLSVQGTIAIVVAFGLLVAPGFMTKLWPWTISALLAQLYGAPFLSYGIGSLLAARQRAWRDVRIVVVTVLVFALGVLVASFIHSSLFNPHAITTWVWFGSFALAIAFNLWFARSTR